MRALKRNAPLIRFLISTRIYCLLVYIVCFSTYSFLHFFFTYLLLYLFPSEYTRSVSRPDVVKGY